MSANNARRHSTPRTEVGNLARRRTERVLGLLALRDRLAIAAAEYEAHDLEGATEMLIQQYQIEAAIREFAPTIHEARWAEWIERDTKLAHLPSEPHPECGVCKMLQLQRNLGDHPWTGRAS
jgi:hypothetical protein